MSSVETLRDKSKQEIMNWMIANLTPEQIASCTDESIGSPLFEPSGPDPSEPSCKESPAGPSGPSGPSGPIVNNDLDKIREYCAGKRYVIHKIIGNEPKKDQPDKREVSFWYYTSGEWKYYTKSYTDFLANKDGKSEECGDDTLISDSIKKELSNSYYNNLVNDKGDEFRQIKSEYNPEYISSFEQSSHLVDVYDNLLTALQVIKGNNLTDTNTLKPLFEFPPILVYGANSEYIYYYYLTYNNGSFSFKRGFETINNFADDIVVVMKGIQNNIDIKSKSPEQFKNDIRQALCNVSIEHLKFIKTIFFEHPLSQTQVFFMKNLLSDNAQNSFGKNCNDREEMKDYMNSYYGKK